MAGLDLSPQLLRAVRARLLADPALRPLVGDRVREVVSAREEWPFLRVDPPEVGPYEAQGWRGCACRLTIHAFLRGARGLGPVQELLAAVTVEAPGLIAREFGTATRSARPVIGPAVANLTGRG